jgi:ADP-ribose pyrophosphatase
VIFVVWKINHSTKKKVDRFGIVMDEVILSNGEKKTFSYLDFAKGVCILAITNDQKVICINQYRHALKSWQWELPAGMIDFPSDSPLDTAKKELEEETGYLAGQWLDLGSFYPSPGSTTEEIYLFAATNLTSTTQKLEASEQIEVHMLGMEEFKTLIKKGDFKHGAGLAAFLRYSLLANDQI